MKRALLLWQAPFFITDLITLCHFKGGMKGIYWANNQQRKKTSGMCTNIWSTE